MNWFNPQNWSDEKDYGLDEILEFSNQFNEPLAEAGYDHSKITQEWKKMRRYVEINLPKKEPAQLWRNIINHNERGISKHFFTCQIDALFIRIQLLSREGLYSFNNDAIR